MHLFIFKYRKLIMVVLGFFLACVFTQQLPPSYMHTTHTDDPRSVFLKKLQYFKEHKDEYTTVFVGSSAIYRHIDVSYFDELIAKNFPDSKSFNFGVPGIGWLEDLYILNYIHDLKPKKLKYLFFEIQAYPQSYLENLSSFENLIEHDSKHTLLTLKTTALSDEPILFKIDQFYFHSISFLYRSICVGCIANYLTEPLKKENFLDADIYDNYDKTGGFKSLDQEPSRRRLENEEFLKTAEAGMKKLISEQTERLQLKESTPAKGDSADEYIFALAKAAQFAPEPIIIVPPRIKGRISIEGRAAYLQNKTGLKVWDYIDSRKFPEFYKIENRWEYFHLNEKGARLFTERVAEEFNRTFESKSK